jgi:hypothetical protein
MTENGVLGVGETSVAGAALVTVDLEVAGAEKSDGVAKACVPFAC